LLLALAAGPVSAGNAAAPSPQAIIQTLSADVLATLHADKGMLRKDPAAVAAQIAGIVDPYVDFRIVSEEVLGVGWRRADERQRARFTQIFHQLLTQDYAAAFKQYAGQTIKVTGMRWEDAAHDRATVSSRIEGAGTQPVQVDYRMYRTGGTWKVYDVVVDGISLLINYREAFASELQQESLDRLISRLVQKVAALQPAASQ
jgi:phospholipid transport system substrate-binding protein